MLVATELLKKTAENASLLPQPFRGDSVTLTCKLGHQKKEASQKDWGQPREEETIAVTDAKEEITETETESTEVTDEQQSEGKD